MNYKVQKTLRSIKQTKILTVALLGILTLSLPALAKNTETLMLDNVNLDENVILDRNVIKELINKNIQFQSGPNKKLSRLEIENIALKQFIYYRNHGALVGANFRELRSTNLNQGVICFQSYGQEFLALRKKTEEYSTKIDIDEQGNFSVSLGGNGEYLNKVDVKAASAGTIIGKRRNDGYYNIYLVQINLSGEYVKADQHICDSNGNIVNQEIIRQRSQSYLEKELNKIQYLNDVNNNLVSSILAGNDVYDIDYVQKDGTQTIYADKLDANIEIRFVKTDAKTIYGVYIISSNSKGRSQESNTGSEIYAFKYSDESTAKKQRIQFMTKRVVQYDFDEQYPATQKYSNGTKGREVSSSEEFTLKTGLFTRRMTTTTSQKLNSIYENFMCEGVIYTTYTQGDKGRFYKNQQEMF